MEDWRLLCNYLRLLDQLIALSNLPACAGDRGDRASIFKIKALISGRTSVNRLVGMSSNTHVDGNGSNFICGEIHEVIR